MKVCLVCYNYSLQTHEACCYPLGFMYVSAELKRLGHTVKVLNYNLFEYDFVEEIKGFDIVGFTGFEEFATAIIRDAKICKELGIKTMLGGALATFIPETMRKYVDYLCIGEFQETSNIDQIPWPDYEGFGIDEYNARHDYRYMGVLTSRGCPFNCTFCAHTCKFSVRNLAKVFAEIQYYKSKYKIDTVIFNDNTLNITKSRFMKVCKWLEGRKLRWTAAIRCDVFDKEMAVAAKKSNCAHFVIGVESFSQERLDKMNKKLKVEDIFKTVDLLQEHKIKYHGNVLVGLEGESYEDVVKEVNNIPNGCVIFPVLMLPVAGAKTERSKLLTDQQIAYLSAEFNTYIEDAGYVVLGAKSA